MKRYKINKIGLLNFWLYDEEEFYFSDGKLLLRGSNGSGKSVTMQSFIPLLFDGNKSSERLDSFGSKSRKIDDYLLMEGDNSEDHTGYLYMELYDGNKYLTIGMGLKAVRNKGTSFWGFSLTGNQRVNVDFLLYKNRASKIPLTKKELIAAIGTDGVVVDTMKEYKKMVNDLVFGFPNMDMYDEFINLLLQIRSPKLSNSYKPKDLTLILSNVLQPLSEEEIMPMSEAIMQMNKSKEQIEELEQEQKALNYLLPYYKEYNERVLYEKATDYYQAFYQKKDFDQEILDLTTKTNLLKNDNVENKKLKVALEEQYQELLFKKKDFNNKEIEDITTDITSFLENIKNFEERVNDKIEKSDRKKESIISVEAKQKELQNQFYKISKNIDEFLIELKETNQEINVDSLTFYLDEYFKTKTTFIQFQPWKKELSDYLNFLNNLIDKLEQIEEVKLRIDDNQKEAGSINTKIGEITKKININQEKLMDILDQYKKYLEDYNNQNSELTFSNEKLITFYQLLDKYDSNTFPKIKNGISDIVLSKSQEYMQKNNTYKEKVSYLEISINELNQEKEKINRGDLFDDFLEMKEASTYLIENNIPFIPLYQAIAFKSNVSADIKNKIEASLIDMGLINSYIINAQDITKIPNNLKGKYLVKGETYTNNISQYFDIYENDNISKKTIVDILSCISINDSDMFYISQNGTYKANLMLGKADKRQNRFIGFEVRENYIKSKLQELDLQLTKLVEEQKILERNILNNLNKIEILNQEFTRLEEIQTEEVIKLINSDNLNLDFQKQLLEENIVKYNVFNDTLEQLNLNIFEYKKMYSGSFTIENVVGTKNNLIFYQKTVEELSIEQLKLSNVNEQILSNKNTLEQLNEDFDEIQVDISEINTSIRHNQMKIDNLNQLLNDESLKKMKDELLEIDGKIDTIQNEKEQLTMDYTRKEKDIEYLDKAILEKNNTVLVLTNELQILKLIFQKEADLKYVYNEEYDLMNLCEKVIKETKINKNITAEEIYNKLLDAQFKVNTILAKFTPSLETILEIDDNEKAEIDNLKLFNKSKRNDLLFKYNGKTMNLLDLTSLINDRLIECRLLLNEEDRKLFQDILINNIGSAIRKRIYASEEWIKNIKDLMESMQTSSGLSFSIAWQNVEGETEDEVNSKEIVTILKKDPKLVTDDDYDKITKHFRSKIKRAEDNAQDRYYYNIIFDVLDYRKWFNFKLFYKRTGEDKKELTDKYFNKFSGGEKAIAMYIPLFSSIYAKYKSAKEGALKIIALDEAFAGVDDENIKDAFRIIESLDLDYLLTSQILWGDYETIKSLAISELNRPNNSNVVSVINYKWEGNKRIFVTNKDYE